jgi:hypothetical protein
MLRDYLNDTSVINYFYCTVIERRKRQNQFYDCGRAEQISINISGNISGLSTIEMIALLLNNGSPFIEYISTSFIFFIFTDIVFINNNSFRLKLFNFN